MTHLCASSTDPFVSDVHRVDTIANLRLVPLPQVRTVYVTEGGVTAGDGLGRVYYWDSASTGTDNGTTIIQITGETTGRFLDLPIVAGAYEPLVTVITDSAANHDLLLVEANKYLRMTRATANTVTVPANATVAFPLNTKISGIQAGAGQTTLTPAGGVTINGTPGLKTRAQFSAWSLVKVGTNEWDALGDLAA